MKTFRLYFDDTDHEDVPFVNDIDVVARDIDEAKEKAKALIGTAHIRGGSSIRSDYEN